MHLDGSQETEYCSYVRGEEAEVPISKTGR